MRTVIKVLDHGYVRLVEAWGHGDDGIEKEVETGIGMMPHRADHEVGIIEAARQSTQKGFLGWEPREDAPDGDQGLMRRLHKFNHATPFEFAGMIIEVQAPIFVFREWHRHRTQSYNEMSARYAPLPCDDYVPTLERCMVSTSGNNRQANRAEGAKELEALDAERWLEQLKGIYERLEDHYQTGLNIGVPKELARVALPVGRYSRMRAAANLRNWLGFLKLRQDSAAQWEIRQYANAVGEIIAENFPRTWELFKERK